MSLVDTAWLWIDSIDAPMQVAGLLTFEPTRSVEETVSQLVDTYRSTPAVSRPFTYRVRAGVPPTLARREIDENVDIDYHLRHSALPSPGNERLLAILVSRLHSTPLDKARPMWEAHVIEGLEDNRFALYVKTHHSLLDGVAGVRVITESLASHSGLELAPPPWARPLVRPASDTTSSTPRDRLARAGEALRNGGEAARAVATLWRARRAGGALKGPFCAPRSLLNMQWRFSDRPIRSFRVATTIHWLIAGDMRSPPLSGREWGGPYPGSARRWE